MTSERTKAEGRAEGMMVAALDLFAQRGVSSVTIIDIAQALKVNTALIYYYFDSKDDLFRASLKYCIGRTIANFSRLEGRHDDPVKMISAWFQTNAQMHPEIRQLVKVMLDYSSLEIKTRDTDALVKDFYQQESRILSDSIRLGVRQGVFGPVNVRQAALFASTHLDGIMLRSIIQKDLDVPLAIRTLQRVFFGHLGVRAVRGNARARSGLPAAPALHV